MTDIGSSALSAVFFALSDPTRRELLNRLSKGTELTVSELAEPLEMSLPAASKHLKILERAGLIDRRRDGQRFYMQLNPEPLKDATEWLAYYERFWSESLDRLTDYLNDTIEKTDDEGSDSTDVE